MAASPVIKVYTADGEYVASVKDYTLAGALMAVLGEGATVRMGHRNIIFTEGTDGDSADSYDAVAWHVRRGLDGPPVSKEERS